MIYTRCVLVFGCLTLAGCAPGGLNRASGQRIDGEFDTGAPQDELPPEWRMPEDIPEAQRSDAYSRQIREWLTTQRQPVDVEVDVAFEFLGEPTTVTDDAGVSRVTVGLNIPAELGDIKRPETGAWGPRHIRLPNSGQGQAETYLGWPFSDPGTQTIGWSGDAFGGEFEASMTVSGTSVLGWWEAPDGTWEFEGVVGGTAYAWKAGAPTGCAMGGEGPDLTGPEEEGIPIMSFWGATPGTLGDKIDVLVLYEDAPSCFIWGSQACDVQDRIDRSHGSGLPAGTFTPNMIAGAAMAKVQAAFTRSNAGGDLRVVGVQSFPRDIADGVCAARTTLNDASTAQGGDVLLARDAVNADLVLVLSASPMGSGFTGCAAFPAQPGTSTKDNSYVAVIKVGAGAGASTLPTVDTPQSWAIYTHEVGHLFGLMHDRSNPNDLPSIWELTSPAGPSYSFGHTACAGSTALASVESYFDSRYCGAAAGAWSWYNRFSDTGVNFPGTSVAMGSSTSVVITPAETDPDILARTTKNATRLRENVDDISMYRTSTVSIVTADISSPAGGATLWSGGASETFTWSGAGAGAAHVLELGDLDGVVFSTTSITATSTVVPDQVGLHNRPIIVRLWSQPAGTTTWSWREYRYNTRDRVTDCSLEAYSETLSDTYAYSTCQSGGSPVCTYDGTLGEITCDVSLATGSNFPVAGVYGSPTGPVDWYHMAFMGKGEDGAKFCCLIADNSSAISRVNILGSPTADLIDLDTSGFPATSWAGTITFDIQGKDGGDAITGSSSTAIGYVEELRGFNGNDAIVGRDGADVLVGGSGDDDLFGDVGSDTLIGKPGSDDLFGGLGSDTLCEEEKSSKMIGEDLFKSTETTILFWKQGASGTLNILTNGNTGTVSCGDSSYGLLTDCTTATLTALPGRCADFMTP